MWESEEQMVADLIADGSATHTSVDPDGEVRIHWNMELLEILHPAVHQAVQESILEEVNEALSSLHDQGLIHMGVEEKDGDLEPVYWLTPEGEKFVEHLRGQGLDK